MASSTRGRRREIITSKSGASRAATFAKSICVGPASGARNRTSTAITMLIARAARNLRGWMRSLAIYNPGPAAVGAHDFRGDLKHTAQQIGPERLRRAAIGHDLAVIQ